METLKKMASSPRFSLGKRRGSAEDATLDGDDLARGVAHLNDATILKTLHERYDSGVIYSSVNRMLIAVNPYADLGLYTSQRLAEYAELAAERAPPPHAYAIAAAAYKGLLAGGSQSIVITGESGAGKTETAKRMMQFLAYMAGAHVGDATASLKLELGPSDDRKSAAALHVTLLRTNAVMEAFGNARTTMNDNSSRFGKFLAVQYDASAKLLGAQINTYLLEKTRVVRRGEGEASFHVLYMVLLGLGPSEAGQLALTPDPHAYRYARLRGAELDGSGREGLSWPAQLAEVRSVLTGAIGLGAADVWAILGVLAAVLHCGNIDFATPASGHTSTGAALNEGALRPLRALATLLGIEAGKLCDALTTRCIRAGTEWVTKPNTTREATDLADALAKQLYARVFDRVGAAINAAIGVGRAAADGGAPTASGAAAPVAHSFIGILDIFGFELFAENSLEQLLINYTNEQLQSLFNGVVFAAALAEAKLEGVSMAAFDEGSVDNRDVLSLFNAERVGLVPTLNEECIFPKGSDESFVAKFKRANAKNARLVDDSSNAKADPKGTFTVRHFAGLVTYSAEGFLLKNKDPFSEDLAALLRGSSEPLVGALFAPPTAERTSSKRSGAFQRLVFRGVAPQFEAQLQRLLRVLRASQVHFVRCVKPNGEKAARRFEDERVLAQLRCGGVMEAVRVFAAGYPDRIPFDTFAARYGLLAGPAWAAEWGAPPAPPSPASSGSAGGGGGSGGGAAASAERVRALLAAIAIPPERYALGHSKLFLKSGVAPELELRRERKVAARAVQCQAAVRGMLARAHARRLAAAARESTERRRKADESARALDELERATEAERVREREQEAARAREESARADEAAAAAAAEAARSREAERARDAELLAARQRAAELEAALSTARTEADGLRTQVAAAATNPAAAAPPPPPPRPTTPPGASAAAIEEAKATAKRALEEVSELRAALERARDEIVRERAANEKRRSEAETTNRRWQAEAQRASAEQRRQAALRDAERRLYQDKLDDLTWERDFWREETHRRYLQEAAAAEAKRLDLERAQRSTAGAVVDAVVGAASAAASVAGSMLGRGGGGPGGARAIGAADPSDASIEFTPLVPPGVQDVNPVCRPKGSPGKGKRGGRGRGGRGGGGAGGAGGGDAAAASAAAKGGAAASASSSVGGAPAAASPWSDEVLEYAEYMGLDPATDAELMWIADDLRSAPLPPGWALQRDPTGGLYFYNEVTGESMLKHPLDLQYKQLISEHRLERAMTGAKPPPAESFGTMTIRSMEDSLLVVPGAETHVSARLAVPSAPAAGSASAASLLLPQYVLHTVLMARLIPDRTVPETVPILWASCLQQDAHTVIFSLAREADGSEFACVVARNACARSTLYVTEEGAAVEKETSAVVLREPFSGAGFAHVDVVLPMPRADGKAGGVPCKRREEQLLKQYEAGKKGQLVVLCGQVKADSRSLEATLALPSRAAGAGGKASAPLMQMRQSAGGADMEVKYRDKITPVQVMHVVLTLSRWWSMRQASRPRGASHSSPSH